MAGEAHFNLGVAYLRQREYEKAIEHSAASAVSAVGELKAEALTNAGVAARAVGRLEEAVSFLEEATGITGTARNNALVELVVVYWKLGRLDDARKASERAIREVGNNATLLLNSAELRVVLGDFDEALALASKAAAVDKSPRVQVLSSLFQALAEFGKSRRSEGVERLRAMAQTVEANWSSFPRLNWNFTDQEGFVNSLPPIQKDMILAAQNLAQRKLTPKSFLQRLDQLAATSNDSPLVEKSS